MNKVYTALLTATVAIVAVAVQMLVPLTHTIAGLGRGNPSSPECMALERSPLVSTNSESLSFVIVANMSAKQIVATTRGGLDSGRAVPLRSSEGSEAEHSTPRYDGLIAVVTNRGGTFPCEGGLVSTLQRM
jgi:hypothetical protein